jgi:hypothetical protein
LGEGKVMAIVGLLLQVHLQNSVVIGCPFVNDRAINVHRLTSLHEKNLMIPNGK